MLLVVSGIMGSLYFFNCYAVKKWTKNKSFRKKYIEYYIVSGAVPDIILNDNHPDNNQNPDNNPEN